MRIARIARPGAIYDASAKAPTFTEGEIGDFQIGLGEIPKTGDGKYAEINKMRLRTNGLIP